MTDEQKVKDGKFIGNLEYYAKSRDSEGPERGEARAALAILRRGAGKPLGEVPDMYPYVVPYLDDRRSSERPDMRWWQEDVYYLVASLFAHHALHPPPEGSASTNFGDSFAQYVTQKAQAPGSSRETVQKGADRRFALLLDSDRTALPRNLRHAIGLLAGVHINWFALLQDLKHWEREGKPVQRWWAKRYFYRDVKRADEAASRGEGSDTEPEDDAADDTEE